MFRVPLAVLFMLLFFTPVPASAGVLVSFNFDDGSCEPTTLGNGITSTAFQATDGLRCIMIGGQMLGWGFSSSPNNDYWSFTVSAAPGSVLELESIAIRERRFLFGPQIFQWIVEGKALDSTKRTTLFPATNRALDLSSPEFQDLTSATFRLIAWGAPSEMLFSGWMVDDVVVHGSLLASDDGASSSVHTPEATSFVAWALVLLGGLAVNRIRQRRVASLSQ
jgi:hypothetical protein